MGILGLGIARSSAQSVTDLKIPPVPVEFSTWKLQAENAWGTEYLLEFSSPRASAYAKNDQVPLRVFVPKGDGPFPAVVVLHYLGAQDLRVERVLAQELCKRGIGAAVLALPYHLERTPAGFQSGELAIVPDTQSLRDNLTQAVLDCRRAIDFLAARPEFDPKRIGVSGVSLGAIVSGLLYGVDERLSRAAFVLGGADLANILWKSTRVVSQREVLRGKGYDEEKLRAELANVEPLTYLGTRRAERRQTLVVQAKFDTVIPASSSSALIRALGEPSVVHIETGHYGGVLVQRRILGEVAKYFEIAFAGREYVAPDRLYAPTLRIGVLSSTNARLDLGIGLDLWQLDGRGKTITTLFATPRGLQIVLGRKIGQGLSIGLNAGSHGVGAGLFWSSVL